MYTVHLDTLGMIQDFRLIAASITFHCRPLNNNIFDIHGVRISIIYFGLFDLLNDLSFVTRFIHKNDYGCPQDK